MRKNGRVILIGGEKGGTSKSTTATNLAVYLVLEGHDVMLLDADKQPSTSNWVERRNNAGLPTIHCTQKQGEVYQTAIDLAQRYSYVIIDSGGRDSRELRSAMLAADLMYIPIQASQFDLETLEKMNELVGLARAMNPGLVARALVTMAPNNPLNSEIPDAKELLKQCPELELSDCVIHTRKVYRDAASEGRGVIEMGNSKARAEIQLLAQEVFA